MKNLFEKTKIKNMAMKNRFVRSTLYEKLADAALRAKKSWF